MAVEQLCDFGLATITGACLGMLYDILRAGRRTVKCSQTVLIVEDILYWLIIALAIFFMVLYSNNGVFRGYLFLALAIGAGLYFSLLSKYILKILVSIAQLLRYVIIAIYTIIKTPIVFAAKLIYLPVIWLYKKIKKMIEHIVFVVRKRTAKAAKKKNERTKTDEKKKINARKRTPRKQNNRRKTRRIVSKKRKNS